VVARKDGGYFKNIYAAGECTGGIHGKSRLGSMALMEGLVMGRIAGSSK
jgi:urocanate reductase